MLETVGKHMQNKTKPIFMSSLQGQTRLYEKRLKLFFNVTLLWGCLVVLGVLAVVSKPTRPCTSDRPVSTLPIRQYISYETRDHI